MIEPSFEDVVSSVASAVDLLPTAPDVLVAVGRGGLVVGVVASHLLGPHRFVPLVARTTASDDPESFKTAPVVLNEMAIDLSGADVVVIDDIVGSGQTLATVARWTAEAGAKCVTVVAAFQNLDNQTDAVPAGLIVGRRVRGWVRFPWERPAPPPRAFHQSP